MNMIGAALPMAAARSRARKPARLSPARGRGAKEDRRANPRVSRGQDETERATKRMAGHRDPPCVHVRQSPKERKTRARFLEFLTLEQLQLHAVASIEPVCGERARHQFSVRGALPFRQPYALSEQKEEYVPVAREHGSERASLVDRDCITGAVAAVIEQDGGEWSVTGRAPQERAQLQRAARPTASGRERDRDGRRGERPAEAARAPVAPSRSRTIPRRLVQSRQLQHR